MGVAKLSVLLASLCFSCAFWALQTPTPRVADCVVGAYFPRRKARREVSPPPSNKFTFREFHVLIRNGKKHEFLKAAPMRRSANRASVSEANLTVLYRNRTFTTFTDLFEIHLKMESYITIRIPGDPRCRHGWACGGRKSHRTIGFFVFFMYVLGAPDTDSPRRGLRGRGVLSSQEG